MAIIDVLSSTATSIVLVSLLLPIFVPRLRRGHHPPRYSLVSFGLLLSLITLECVLRTGVLDSIDYWNPPPAVAADVRIREDHNQVSLRHPFYFNDVEHGKIASKGTLRIAVLGELKANRANGHPGGLVTEIYAREAAHLVLSLFPNT
jgi:hypothetical protein